jgi:hypothetical protein
MKIVQTDFPYVHFSWYRQRNRARVQASYHLGDSQRRHTFALAASAEQSGDSQPWSQVRRGPESDLLFCIRERWRGING